APIDEEDGEEALERAASSTYRWWIFGGENPDQEIRGDLRRYIQFIYLDALRNAAADLTSWRRSPLRPLVDSAAVTIDVDELAAVAQKLDDATRELTGLEPLPALAARVTNEIKSLVGPDRPLQTSLGIAPADPMRLIRS